MASKDKGHTTKHEEKKKAVKGIKEKRREKKAKKHAAAVPGVTRI
jgi:hypothetical protein